MDVSTAISVAFAAVCPNSAWAGLPSEVNPGHPRLYGSKLDFQRMKSEAATGIADLPKVAGELRFSITPVAWKSVSGPPISIFGDRDRPNSIYVVHYSNGGGGNTTRLYVVFKGATGNNLEQVFDIPIGVRSDFVVGYNTSTQTATFKVGSNILPSRSIGNWAPKDQPFFFRPLAGTVLSDIWVTDLAAVGGSKTELLTFPGQTLDLPLASAWRSYVERAERAVGRLAACPQQVDDSNDTECNTRRGGRNAITEPAEWLSMAYRLTKKQKFLDAAKTHIELILNTPVGDVVDDESDSPEWSMSGRVGALGIYYDWLYDELGSPKRDQLAAKIKETIRYDTASQSDLVNYACGNQPLSNTAFKCDTDPEMTWTGTPGAKTISDTYLGGHSASGNFGSALGLLAIVEEHPDVKPLLNTIYDHFAQGYVPARDYFSIDGGNYALFGYGSGGGENAERLAVWRRALQPPVAPAKVVETVAAPHMVYPYIYAVRADGSFPARGDSGPFTASATGALAMAAIGANTNGDAHAAKFYWNDIHPYRVAEGLESGMIMERLMYKKPTTSNPVTSLPLSRHFSVSGNVLMRDRWTPSDTTLLEFKSTSFISINHHHMDQNSYSLYYKAPLLLDSGQYDKYGSNHWHNYYIRSIAHNTVTMFDKGEVFKLNDTKYLLNDGGQWLGARTFNPRLDQIKAAEPNKPAGSNWLDGVTAFEEGGTFSYVLGNASKAYLPNKIDSAAGFLRSIVYLRRDDNAGPPKILVFDSVRPTKNNLEITSLLHTATEPSSTVTPIAIPGEPGRYRLPFINKVDPITVRNEKGMVTVQTLLPIDASVIISGGTNGASCKQAHDSFYNKDASVDNPDCRFLVRAKEADGTLSWRNVAILEPSDGVGMTAQSTTDTGAWRMQISPKTPPAAGSTQHFLNVLHVADVDQKPDGAADISDAAVVLSQDISGVAVKMKDGQTIVFSSSAAPATNIRWKPDSNSTGRTLVFGLAKNAKFMLTSPGQDGWVELKPSTTGSYLSSIHGGVVRINP
ncbi:heparinase II/III domain-containing protein [Pseudoduganella lutea]|uniref:Heparinase II/III-like C-terminal domain-containing protein n=1 Tax=Pseudoduganella lutea TaxID=321985 RepID=A0A4P6KWC5_9BURK|nr:heparinase II/III family protein [Pseudoduganella lutea]QBE62772.1 hypothetical protein EWM63_07155 [Pseudoduganella lutea]